MARLVRIANQPVTRFISVVAIALSALLSVSGQSQNNEPLATLRGIIRDSQGKPAAGATVRLHAKDGGSIADADTDLQGGFSFSGLRSGVYSMRAEMGAYAADISAIFLQPNETKNVDLTLAPIKAPPATAAQSPKFYDQPQFTVSGVTDTTNLGGHGSDVIVRTRETLARETVRLSDGNPGPQPNSPSAMEQSLRDQVAREPNSYEANHLLGETLLQDGKAKDAIAYFERASALKPDDYANTFDLARADADIGNYERARQSAHDLLAHNDKAELHHLLGDVEERLGNSLEAVRQYEHAAAMDPREAYIFDWGAELLLHHAPEPALEVFGRGNRLFPDSIRMLVGLGAALFAGGSYEQAVQRICEASDLDPKNPVPYLFLGKIDRAESPRSDALVDRLRRFAEVHPESAEANYYYAVSLWNRRTTADGTAAQVESLLNIALRLDTQFAAAYLQLGIVYSAQRQFPEAIQDYQRAIKWAPQMEEAHYRLAQAYRQVGETEKARTEIDIYGKMAKQSSEEAERERHEIRQFVYTLRDRPPKQTQ